MSLLFWKKTPKKQEISLEKKGYNETPADKIERPEPSALPASKVVEEPIKIESYTHAMFILGRLTGQIQSLDTMRINGSSQGSVIILKEPLLSILNSLADYFGNNPPVEVKKTTKKVKGKKS